MRSFIIVGILLVPLTNAGCATPLHFAATSAPSVAVASTKPSRQPDTQTPPTTRGTQAALLLRRLDQMRIESGYPRVVYNAAGEPTAFSLVNDLVADEHIQLLDAFPKLTQIKMFCGGSEIAPETFDHLGNLPALEELWVSSGHPVFSKDIATAVARIRTLRVLYIRYAHVNFESLRILAKLPVLRTLAVCEQPGFGDVDAAALAQFTTVEELDLSGTGVTDNCLKDLALMPRLKKLTLRRTAVTDNCARHLAAMPGLEELDLSQTGVTDKCLKELAAMPRLKKLNGWHTAITDAGLRAAGLADRIPRPLSRPSER